MNKLIKIFVIGFISFIIYSEVSAQSNTWMKYYDYNNLGRDDIGLDVVESYEGGYMILATTRINDYWAIWLIKTDIFGTIDFQKIINVDFVYLNPEKIKQTSDSGYVILVRESTDSSAIYKTDRVGNLLWKKKYGFAGGSTDLFSLKITFDKGMITCGSVFYISPPGQKALVIKTDSNGNLEWSKLYKELQFTSASDIIQGFDNNYYFVGDTGFGGTGYTFIYKIHNFGDTIWTRQYVGGFNIIQISTGEIFTGSTSGFRLIKLDTTGQTMWIHSYPGNVIDMIATPDNYIVGAGYVSDDVSFSKINPDSNLVFTKRINTSGDAVDNVRSIKTTSDKGYIMVGTTTFGGSNSFENVLAIKADSLGNTSPIININNLNNNSLKDFELYQNFPNPFNPVTNIKFDILKAGFVTIAVYSILGKQVYGYYGYLRVGNYQIKFDSNKFNLSSGIYYYSLTINEFKKTLKMLLLK